MFSKRKPMFWYTIKITDYQLFSCVGRPLACSAIVGSISTFLFVPFDTLISKYLIIEFIARKRSSEGKIMLGSCCVWILLYIFLTCIKSCRLRKTFFNQLCKFPRHYDLPEFLDFSYFGGNQNWNMLSCCAMHSYYLIYFSN